MNGDEARRAERERALSGDPKAQARFRRLSKAMHEVAEMKPPTISWAAFGQLVGSTRKDLNSWKTYLHMANQWSVFPIPPHSFNSHGITVALPQPAPNALEGPFSFADPNPAVSSAHVTSNATGDAGETTDAGVSSHSESADAGNDVSFKVAAVLPIVFRLITDRTWKSGPYVTHDEIMAALMSDLDGGPLVQAAHAKSGIAPSKIASNMIAWFSQNYTTGKNEFEQYLERMKVAGRWAYRSLQTTGTGVAADDDAIFALEGKPLLVSHLKRERNSKLREQKLASVQAKLGSLECEACGFQTSEQFPELGKV